MVLCNVHWQQAMDTKHVHSLEGNVCSGKSIGHMGPQLKNKSISIAWRKCMHAVVKALATWGPHLKNKGISIAWRKCMHAVVKALVTWGPNKRTKELYCTVLINSSVVIICNTGTSRDQSIKHLVR